MHAKAYTPTCIAEVMKRMLSSSSLSCSCDMGGQHNAATTARHVAVHSEAHQQLDLDPTPRQLAARAPIARHAASTQWYTHDLTLFP